MTFRTRMKESKVHIWNIYFKIVSIIYGFHLSRINFIWHQKEYILLDQKDHLLLPLPHIKGSFFDIVHTVSCVDRMSYRKTEMKLVLDKSFIIFLMRRDCSRMLICSSKQRTSDVLCWTKKILHFIFNVAQPS